MSKNTDLLFELINIWAKEQQFYSKQGTVKSVDTDAKTCVVTPSDGGPDILDVRFESDEDTTNKGFFVVPASGSLVIVSFMSPQESFVSCWTEIDQVIAIQGQWQFNEGDNGGLVKVKELTDRINELEGLLKQLQDDFTAWTPVSQDGGAALKAVISAGFGLEQVPDSKKSDFENEDVVH